MSSRRTSTSTSVASRFDAATFAIYAVGCLQIPLVDVICTLDRQRDDGEDGRGREASSERSALALWHDTTARLASLMLPLAAFFLLTAHAVIVVAVHDAATWPACRSSGLVPDDSAVGRLRSTPCCACTRRRAFLLVMNCVRLAVIVGADRLVHVDASA